MFHNDVVQPFLSLSVSDCDTFGVVLPGDDSINVFFLRAATNPSHVASNVVVRESAVGPQWPITGGERKGQEQQQKDGLPYSVPNNISDEATKTKNGRTDYYFHVLAHVVRTHDVFSYHVVSNDVFSYHVFSDTLLHRFVH